MIRLAHFADTRALVPLMRMHRVDPSYWPSWRNAPRWLRLMYRANRRRKRLRGRERQVYSWPPGQRLRVLDVTRPGLAETHGPGSRRPPPWAR